MSNRYVILNIINSFQPFSLKIISSNGIVIKNQIVYLGTTKICVKISGKTIKLIARYTKYVSYKTIYLSNKKCQNICLNFAFNNSVFQKTINILSLLDKNYGFLVNKAILNFKKISSNKIKE